MIIIKMIFTDVDQFINRMGTNRLIANKKSKVTRSAFTFEEDIVTSEFSSLVFYYQLFGQIITYPLII